MKARNVIISLFFVLALFLFVFMKISSEPKRKLIFNRNLSKVEYSPLALCLMDCQEITANDVTFLLRNGDVVSKAINKQGCPSYILSGKTKAGLSIKVFVIQCGRAIKIYKCYRSDHTNNCDCGDENILPVSFIKINSNAFSA